MRKLFGFVLAFAAIAAINLTPIGADDKAKKDQPKEKLKTDIEVPYVPTAKDVVNGMLKLAAVKEGETVYDLGCGDGRFVITAVKDFKAKKGLGVDFNPERLEDCKKAMDAAKLTDEQRKALTFKHGDVLKMTAADFKDVDVVTLYLLPSVNLRLRPVLQEGLKEGARIVSHDFDMGDWAPEKKETLKATDDAGFTREHTMYLWTIKKK